ncbi:hypothetical protein FKM82_022537 [Ascaphus truei]
MASLVIFMQLRYLFYEVQRRLRRHKNYLRVVGNMEAHFAVATPEELEANNDDCAICWDSMQAARKLPCGHLFHNSCLRSWLEQDTSCPICRMSLNMAESSRAREEQQRDNMGHTLLPLAVTEGRPRLNHHNHFFHFDGSRIASWLPSFSVEVMHTTNILGIAQAGNSQLNAMVRLGRQRAEFSAGGDMVGRRQGAACGRGGGGGGGMERRAAGEAAGEAAGARVRRGWRRSGVRCGGEGGRERCGGGRMEQSVVGEAAGSKLRWGRRQGAECSGEAAGSELRCGRWQGAECDGGGGREWWAWEAGGGERGRQETVCGGGSER